MLQVKKVFKGRHQGFNLDSSLCLITHGVTLGKILLRACFHIYKMGVITSALGFIEGVLYLHDALGRVSGPR